VQEFTSTVGNAVRAIYHDYMGWFDGRIDHLTTVSTAQQAAYLIDVAGGPDKLLVKARQYASAPEPERWQEALHLCWALRVASPSAELDDLYVAVLGKLAYSQKSGQLRNYYLLEAARAEAAMAGSLGGRSYGE
jgi:alkyl sulfatase BDS1-like metallo-beta-lactamase superfamily hydrolase